MIVQEFNNTRFGVKDIANFFIEKDYLFPDPFSNHVRIDSYVDRVLKYGIILVAEENSVIAGIAGMYANDYEKYSGHLQFILVANEFQNKGIGKELIRHVLQTAKTNGMKRVMLTVDLGNKKAEQLYIKSGFIDSAEKHDKKEKKYMEFVFD